MIKKQAAVLFQAFTLRLPDWAGLGRPPDEHVFTTISATEHGGALQTGENVKTLRDFCGSDSLIEGYARTLLPLH